jgi:membrane protein
MPSKHSIFRLLKTTITQWLSDRGPRLAAAFSYYAIFSIGPLLIIALALLGLIYGKKAAADQLRPQIAQFIGEKPAAFIQDLTSALANSAHLSLTGIISIILIIYAASNLFISLQDSLNSIFDVQPKPDRGFLALLRDRALSFLMVVLVGAFIFVSIIITTVIAAFSKSLPTANPLLTSLLLQGANFLVSFFIFTAVFAMMFKYLPDIKITWRDTLIGAAFTSFLFTLARIALGYYLGRSSTTGPFGAAGSLVVVMLFIYYSSQIFFLGAKFTQVYACRDGNPVCPSSNARLLHPPAPASARPI